MIVINRFAAAIFLALIILGAAFKAFAIDAKLAWNPYTDPAAAKLNAYWQAGPNAEFQLMGSAPVTETVMPIVGMLEGIQYAFYMTAETAEGFESENSDTVYYLALPRLKLAGDGLHLSVTPGNTYHVQQSPDFKVWATIGTVTATQAKFVYPVSFDQPMMFLRLLRVEQ